MASVTSDSLLEEALKLSDEERARLASALVASLDGPEDPDVEEAWAKAIERRAGEVLNGEVQATSWDQVQARIRRRLER